MQMFCVIAAGDGQLYACSTRAPDLRRRELAAETGEAVLLWCSVPPPGLKAANLVNAFYTDLHKKLEGAGPLRQLLVLAHFALLGPIMTILRSRTGKAILRQYRKLRFRLGPAGRSLRGSRVEIEPPPR